MIVNKVKLFIIIENLLERFTNSWKYRELKTFSSHSVTIIHLCFYKWTQQTHCVRIQQTHCSWAHWHGPLSDTLDTADALGTADPLGTSDTLGMHAGHSRHARHSRHTGHSRCTAWVCSIVTVINDVQQKHLTQQTHWTQQTRSTQQTYWTQQSHCMDTLDTADIYTGHIGHSRYTGHVVQQTH